MGSLFTYDQNITQLKADLRRQINESGDSIVTEVTSRSDHGESMWYLALKLGSEKLLPAGSVVALTILVYAPRKNEGAGYKDMDEFMGPVRHDGVTKKFLAALTPLPEFVEGEPQSLGWAREWRKRAAAEAERIEKNRAFVKTLAPGSLFELPGRTPKGAFKVTEVRGDGSVRAANGYNVYRVSRAHLEYAVPVQDTRRPEVA